MERRKFIASVGSLTAAGAAGIGTGAFTSTRVNRNVSVDVAGDADSYLGIIASDASAVSTSSEGTISIDLASSSGHGGTGVSNDSLTRIWPAFQLRNQGTDTIYVEMENPLADSDLTDGGVDVQFLAVDDADENVIGDNMPVLFDRTSVVSSVGGWDIGNPAAIAQSVGGVHARGFKGSSRGGSRFKGNDEASTMYLELSPGQDVDVIVRVFAQVDDVDSVDLSDDVTIEAYTDESNTTIEDGEDWLGD
ncbi:hypothetical protein JCM18549_07970 [Halolamina salina]